MKAGLLITVIGPALTFCTLALIIYQNFFRKPKLRVKFYYFLDKRLPHPNLEPSRPALTIVNHGPGEIRIEEVKLRIRPAFCALFGKQTLQTATQLYTNYLPLAVGVADTTGLTFSIDILDLKPLRIGVRDWSGRICWAPKKDLEQAQQNYAEFKKFLAEASSTERPQGS
jgi:hypothetical protein